MYVWRRGYHKNEFCTAVPAPPAAAQKGEAKTEGFDRPCAARGNALTVKVP